MPLKSDPKQWTCYLLHNAGRGKRQTYIGSTNHMYHRIRQHRKEIVGGARTTSEEGSDWRIVLQIRCKGHEEKEQTPVRSLEWHAKRGSRRVRGRNQQAPGFPRVKRGTNVRLVNRCIEMLMTAYCSRGRSWHSQIVHFVWSSHYADMGRTVVKLVNEYRQSVGERREIESLYM